MAAQGVKGSVTFQSTLPSQGATEHFLVCIHQQQNFNPRSPHRERRDWKQASILLNKFQSTLPSQGATSVPSLPETPPTISIHAPLTGSDGEDYKDKALDDLFQSTLPSQGATANMHIKFLCDPPVFNAFLQKFLYSFAFSTDDNLILCYLH